MTRNVHGDDDLSNTLIQDGWETSDCFTSGKSGYMYKVLILSIYADLYSTYTCYFHAIVTPYFLDFMKASYTDATMAPSQNDHGRQNTELAPPPHVQAEQINTPPAPSGTIPSGRARRKLEDNNNNVC